MMRVRPESQNVSGSSEGEICSDGYQLLYVYIQLSAKSIDRTRRHTFATQTCYY